MPSNLRIRSIATPARLLAVALLLAATSAALLMGGCDRQCRVSGDSQALIGGAFEAVDHHGETISSEQFQGRYQLVFFGFTACPDVCPTELSIISTALDSLGERAGYFQPIFVTVDPARDTPDVMATYLDNFHETFIGLTGSDAQIKDLAHVYRAYYARNPDTDEDGSYNMDHSSIVYLMDCEGRYIQHFTHGTSADDMAKTLGDMI